ncbi:MAG: HAMP domain-containing histidine kinase, partial [Elusimicrobia bacterium]|nr:HAMP domain-containing histidine kinase [Elusimicrobiota bacterium]
ALGEAARLESELAVSKAVSDMAAQVAHDIRSPLAALGAAAKGLSADAEQRKLIEGAVGRMQGIADDLLARYRAPGVSAKVAPAVTALAGLIEQVVAEKRLQHRDRAGVTIGFNSDANDVKALVEPKELQRIISNLVNNSVEAFVDGGAVALSLAAAGGRVKLAISDDGKGIPPEVLSKLGQKGGTHGKAGGTGLGLYHARTYAESLGGSFNIKSELGKGTTVTVELPAAGAVTGPVFLLDDDLLVHMNWRTAAKKAGAELKACKTAAELHAALAGQPKEAAIYIDSELGGGVKGEAVAKELHDKGFLNITMATGHAADNFAGLNWLKVTGKEPPWL